MRQTRSSGFLTVRFKPACAATETSWKICFVMICYMVSTRQCANKKASHHAKISVKYCSSKPALGMQGCSVIKNKHLTSLKAVELRSLRSLVHYGIYRTLRCFVHKSYCTMLTEPAKLCQRDVILTFGTLY